MLRRKIWKCPLNLIVPAISSRLYKRPSWERAEQKRRTSRHWNLQEQEDRYQKRTLNKFNNGIGGGGGIKGFNGGSTLPRNNYDNLHPKRSDDFGILDPDGGDGDDDDGATLGETVRETLSDYQRTLRRNKISMQINIARRKYGDGQQEATLLTWAAKAQIKFLHDQKPEEWTPRKIAECFPISEEGAKKFLKSKYQPANEEEIMKHDKRVLKTWKKLKNGDDRGPISTVPNRLLEGKNLNSKMENAAGNPRLPTCATAFHQPIKHEKSGEFSAILTSYSQQKRKVKKVHRLEAELDTDGDVYLETFDASIDKWKPMMQAHEFREQMKQELDQMLEKDTTQVTEKYLNWFKKQQAKPSIDESKLKEMQDENIKIGTTHIDKYRDVTDTKLKHDIQYDEAFKEAYTYDDSFGNQRPYGTTDAPDRIHIPDQAGKPGSVYNQGDAFYDHDGEFLYRVPGLKLSDKVGTD